MKKLSFHTACLSLLATLGCAPEQTPGRGPDDQPPAKSTMLVYCHPRPIRQSTDHFLYGFFSDTVSHDGKKITAFDISTVDISGSHFGVPTYQIDGFSTPFTDDHANQFDYVFVPDCGGDWYNFQDPVINLPGLQGLVATVLKVVKPGGKLILGKFIKPGIADSVSTHFTGTKYTEPKYGPTANEAVIITK